LPPPCPCRASAVRPQHRKKGSFLSFPWLSKYTELYFDHLWLWIVPKENLSLWGFAEQMPRLFHKKQVRDWLLVALQADKLLAVFQRLSIRVSTVSFMLPSNPLVKRIF
jgi:hypothetical protein